MTFPDPRLKGTSRRRFLGSALAAGVVLAADATPITAFAAGGDVTLTADGSISLLAGPGGRLAIRDAGGVTRSAGSKFQVKDKVGETSVTYTSTGGTPKLATLPDGTPAIRMDYTFDAAAGAIAVVGWFSLSTNHAVLEWHITGPATLIPDGFSFSRAILNATEVDDYIAVTAWVRDTRGGIPYEETVGVAHTSTWGTKHGLFLLEQSKQAWTNATWVHAPGVVEPGGGWTSRADFFFSDTRPSATATIGRGDELGLELTTNADFNVYDAPGAPMRITALVANGGTSAKAVQLQLVMRDFDGVQLAASTIPGNVPGMGTWQHIFTVPAPAAGIALAEVVVRSGTDEAFARTNLATLPPYSYQAGANSMFGMANYPWLQRPSEDAVLDMWQRIGVSLVRISYDGGPGSPPSAYDARGMRHNIELQPSLTADANGPAWAETSLGTAVDAGAGYFEVGNELNKPFNQGAQVQEYLDRALHPVFNRRAATGDSIKLMNNGLAGLDKLWVERFIAAGGWDLIDAFAYHPGRGNFTPDYAPAAGPGTEGPTGTYWNFAGGLQQLKALMAEHGPKEIWLTEAYAPTRPNSWWNDTYRHAAENVLLTLALSKAEGIKCVCWYQFYDSVLGMPQVANPANVEYHFGLLNRDLSPKPSLLAYATAARTFDQATFKGRLTFANPKTFGLWFDTPQGSATVLWNRADGYTLNTVGQRTDWHFPAPETWVDTWPTKTALTVAASSAVRQVDAIGRTKTLSPSNGRVTLTLDGAPRIYHGLNPQTVRGVHRLPGCLPRADEGR